MTSIELLVPGISCDHCKRAIESAFAGVGGVQHVEVTVPTKTVHVAYDEVAVSVDAVPAAIEDEGYVIA